MTGTEWTAPGEGSTTGQLLASVFADETAPDSAIRFELLGLAERRTNLRLTGAPITAEDWARLESAEFKVGV